MPPLPRAPDTCCITQLCGSISAPLCPGPSPRIQASLLTSPALCFLRGWMQRAGRVRAVRSIAAPSVGPVAGAQGGGWNSAPSVGFMHGACHRILLEWGLKGGCPPTSLCFCAISIFGTVIAHWRVWIFIYVCVCVCERDERRLLCHFTGSRETGSPCPPHKRCPLWIFGLFYIQGPDTQSLSTSISHLSPFQIPPIERESLEQGYQRGHLR